jgi:hypothetical protein
LLLLAGNKEEWKREERKERRNIVV